MEDPQPWLLPLSSDSPSIFEGLSVFMPRTLLCLATLQNRSRAPRTLGLVMPHLQHCSERGSPSPAERSQLFVALSD